MRGRGRAQRAPSTRRRGDAVRGRRARPVHDRWGCGWPHRTGASPSRRGARWQGSATWIDLRADRRDGGRQRDGRGALRARARRPAVAPYFAARHGPPAPPHARVHRGRARRHARYQARHGDAHAGLGITERDSTASRATSPARWHARRADAQVKAILARSRRCATRSWEASRPVARFPAVLITVEGIDGAGKSTLVAGLAEALREHDPVVLREPGGVELAERLRALVKDPALDGRRARRGARLRRRARAAGRAGAAAAARRGPARAARPLRGLLARLPGRRPRARRRGGARAQRVRHRRPRARPHAAAAHRPGRGARARRRARGGAGPHRVRARGVLDRMRARLRRAGGRRAGALGRDRRRAAARAGARDALAQVAPLLEP